MEPENQSAPSLENPSDTTSPLDAPAESSMPTPPPVESPVPMPASTPPSPTPPPMQQPAPMMSAPQQVAPVAVSFNQPSANGEFPEELRKWNWGAFFLNWLWAISNNTYIGLLALIPAINIYIIIMLGMKGNEWAWKHRKFQSIEHFKKVQRAWSLWGTGIFALGILGIIAVIALGSHSVKTTNPQNNTTRKANVDQIVKDLNAYGADSRNGDVLPLSLTGLGKTEPTDPVTGFEYDYTPSDSGAKAEVCATLSDATKYCKTAEVSTATPDTSTSPSPSSTPL